MRKKILKNYQKGISGVDIVIAMGMIVIFIPLVTTLFVNIYMNWMTTKRNAMANAYATQIIEKIEEMYYDDIDSETINSIKTNLNIPSGYTVDILIYDYNENDDTKEDLLKEITVSIKFKVKGKEENLEVKTIKTKEIIITPNAPKLENDMIAIKMESPSNEFRVVSNKDSTWYSYENKNWANATLKNEIEIDGIDNINNEVNENLVGKEINQIGDLYVWIPRFAYNKTDTIEIKFLYSNTNRYMDEEENKSKIIDLDNYTVPDAFTNEGAELTGFWTIKENDLYVCENEEQNEAVEYLLNSKYGPN